MKSLFKRSALASALLLTSIGAQAGSISFETSDSDTIVIGATSEKVTLRVTGFKNLAPSESSSTKIQLASVYFSSSSSMGNVVIAYGPEHKAIQSGNDLIGTIVNSEGNTIKTALDTTNMGVEITEVNGTLWRTVGSPNYPSGTMRIYSNGTNKLAAGVYPITMLAAIYQP